jgi:hypothetical protein
MSADLTEVFLGRARRGHSRCPAQPGPRRDAPSRAWSAAGVSGSARMVARTVEFPHSPVVLGNFWTALVLDADRRWSVSASVSEGMKWIGASAHPHAMRTLRGRQVTHLGHDEAQIEQRSGVNVSCAAELGRVSRARPPAHAHVVHRLLNHVARRWLQHWPHGQRGRVSQTSRSY